MRLLAATAGPSAQGRLTEAEEIVGLITTDGTFGFIVFTGLFFGLPSGALYMLLRRWLPGGRLAGPAFGLLLLVVAAPYLDPLRPENPDFDIVGPGWLAVVVFSAMALLHGMVVAALAARYSERLPLIELKVRTLIRYLPLLVLLPAFPVLLPVALGAVVAMAVGGLGVWTSSRLDAVGRAVLLAAGLVALPWFIGAVIDIAGRGP
jgi:hypothetical protein